MRAFENTLARQPWGLVAAAFAAACGGGGASGDEGAGGTGGSAGTSADGGAGARPVSGPVEIAVACTDGADDVYVTPADLPPYSPDLRGDVVRCAFDGAATVADVQTQLDTAGVVGVTATSGARTYRIAYRTERAPGAPGLGTAVLILPDDPRTAPVPLVVATHGTAGLADHCAPSRFGSGDGLVLPWAAVGYAVVAPDYAGLGNEGIQGYGHQADTSHSVLDAARALARVAPDPRLSDDVVVAGHSQGGGAAQAAGAFAARYVEPDLHVRHVVSFAGNLQGGGTAGAFLVPNAPIDGAAGVTRSVVMLNLYATFASLFGVDRAAEGFHPSIRDFVANAIETQCIFELTTTLATPAAGFVPPTTVGDAVDPTFRQEMVDCLTGTACSVRADAYVRFASENTVPFEESTSDVLLIGGSADVQAPPSRQACVRDTLDAAGVPFAVCQFPDRTHFDLVPNAIGFAMSRISDAATPCPGSTELPGCTGP